MWKEVVLLLMEGGAAGGYGRNLMVVDGRWKGWWMWKEVVS